MLSIRLRLPSVVRITSKNFGAFCDQHYYQEKGTTSLLRRFLSNSIPTMDRREEGVLASSRDRYRGITVDTNRTEINVAEFPDLLAKSLEVWKENECRSIWFKVNLKSTNLVPILAQNGFDFHHARDGFVMMVRWLPTTETANIPPYSHTMVGVGGLVINSKQQLLTITEKQTIIPGSWKLPGGYVEPGEDLVDAVIREVFEETGVKTRFESLVSVRHAHGFNFGCSDLYIVMALTPVDETDSIVICPREIAGSKWMEFDEYLNNPNVHDLNRQFLKTYIYSKKNGVAINCVEGMHQILKRKYHVFLIEPPAEPKL